MALTRLGQVTEMNARMRAVECPACNCRVEGRSEESEGNKRWSAAGRPNEEPSTRGSASVAESRTGQTRERIGEREESKMSSEGSSISSPETYGVSCPGCRERVTGRSEGETS